MGKSSPPLTHKIAKAIFVLLIATAPSLRGDTAGSVFPATSSELKKEYEQWVHRSWTTENGLPQDTVYALAQTNDGCLWIGSEGGLARFDGTAFTIFKKNTTLGLESNSITSLSPAPDGSLWIGTFGGGLVRLRDGKFTRIWGLPSDRVWSLRHDSAGILWVVPDEGDVYCLENGRGPALAVIDGLPDERVTAIAGSEESILWIATPGGLAAIRAGRETIFSTREGLAGAYVYCLFIDSRGSLWAGTTSGLSRIDARGVRSFSTADGLADNLVRAISEDAQGRMWIGTDKGMTIMEPGEKTLCTTPDGLAGDAVMAVSRDRENGMWIGSASGGLSYWRRNEVRVHGTDDGLSGQQISAICEGPDGRLWIGTRNRGLNQLQKGNWHSFSKRDGLASEAITSLAAGDDGRLWIGTLDSGLQVMDKGRFSTVPRGNGPTVQTVLSLFIDRQENLWVGGDGNGLDRYQNGEWQHHGPARGLKGSVITALGEDRQGNLWAGSARDGLHVLHGGTWRRYTTSDGLAGNTVYAIHTDEKDGIWLGTDNGLGLYRRGRFYDFRQAAGPLNGAILAILEDAAGILWMSSPAGIFSAKRSELEDSAASGGREAHCRFFGEMSGLKSTVCTGGFQPAGCHDRSDRLWFPTQKGLVEIDPGRLGPPPPPPLPRFERVQVSGLTVPIISESGFAAGVERFDFHFAAASFFDPQQIEFSTRLEGIEEGWSKPGRERVRRFSGVSAGNYVFRVRARGQGGTWSEGNAVFRFTIAPFFHHTAGFYLLLLAGTGTIAAGLLLSRKRKARRLLKDKYRSSNLSAGKTSEYLARLEQAMEKDRLYLDPDLTLAKLSAATAIPAKHLSQVINEHFGLNFNDFVNRCRVGEAKRRLLDPALKEFKLLRIAYESGFNSKSVFNGAFRKNTGLSPSEFRRLLGGGS